MQLSSVLGAVDHGVTGTAMIGAVSAAHLLARARHPADQYSIRPRSRSGGARACVPAPSRLVVAAADHPRLHRPIIRTKFDSG